jgi:hypothetical protein
MIATRRIVRARPFRARLVLLSVAGGLAISCGGSGGDRAPTQPSQQQPGQPTQPTAPTPVPGTLTARLVAPNADDGAILIEISGPAPITDVTATAQGAIVHSRANGNKTRLAVFGSLASGTLVRFSVPDANAAQQYSAQVTEVSDRANALRTSVTGYQVTIAP